MSPITDKFTMILYMTPFIRWSCCCHTAPDVLMFRKKNYAFQTRMWTVTDADGNTIFSVTSEIFILCSEMKTPFSVVT